MKQKHINFPTERIGDIKDIYDHLESQPLPAIYCLGFTKEEQDWFIATVSAERINEGIIHESRRIVNADVWGKCSGMETSQDIKDWAEHFSDLAGASEYENKYGIQI